MGRVHSSLPAKLIIERGQVRTENSNKPHGFSTLNPAMNAGLIKMTIPDKPNSRLQQYRLTDTGMKQDMKWS